MITLYLNGKQTLRLIHRIIAETFLGPRKAKRTVNHINGRKKDNRAVNLEWVSHARNIQHSFDTGLNQGRRGEDNGSSKLTSEMVQMIRAARFGNTLKLVAEKYGISKSAVSLICRKKRWKHLA
jgi:hypothetical protein